jgi:hypothetical protein
MHKFKNYTAFNLEISMHVFINYCIHIMNICKFNVQIDIQHRTDICPSWTTFCYQKILNT